MTNLEALKTLDVESFAKIIFRVVKNTIDTEEELVLRLEKEIPENIMGLVEEELQIQIFSNAKTFELVNELKKREGVEVQIAEPHKDKIIEINGPAVVLIVRD